MKREDVHTAQQGGVSVIINQPSSGLVSDIKNMYTDAAACPEEETCHKLQLSSAPKKTKQLYTRLCMFPHQQIRLNIFMKLPLIRIAVHMPPTELEIESKTA